MNKAHHKSSSLTRSITQSALLLAAISLPLQIASTARAGEVTIIDGVAHVRNDASPPNGRLEVTPRELWRRGGPDDELFFGNIARIERDDAGNIYILDTQQCEVTVLTAEGEFVRTLGRSGEGPGELYRPTDFYLRSGGGVGLMQQFPGKVVLVDGDGVPAGSFTISSSAGPASNFMALVDSRSGDGRVVIAGIEMAFDAGLTKQSYFLSAVNAAGTRQVNYLSKENTINFADFVGSEEVMDFVWWGQRWTLATDGQVLANPDRNRYQIQRFSSDGTLVGVIERVYDRWVRGDTERAEAERVLRAALNGYPVPPRTLEIEDADPDISAIYSRKDDSIWVRTSRGDRPKDDHTFAILDVFDPEGHFTHEIDLQLPGDVAADAMYVCGEYILQVTNSLDAFLASGGGSSEADASTTDEERELEIVCYSLADL